SYQLESVAKMRCAAATVLNVTPDHLDRYPSLDEYARAKERIFENQRPGDLAALNGADARVAAMKTGQGVRRALFDPRKDTLALRAKTLRGTHNLENALAASLLAKHFGVNATQLQQGLDTYPGLPHRLEPVRTLEGVEWINDSKATNVDSVEKSLSAFEGGVHIIMGGRGKGAPYAPLLPLVRAKVKTILGIGEDSAKVRDELGAAAEFHDCGILSAAIAKARELAKPGDTVLLSPACASYDQFRNFEDRGEQYKQMVRGLR
ncbi:MAG TPA: UDP-N-acetylmuramoyl-L-alanine--D-glutamate ligase, partial [Myxococcales bacterium]|nr:UDP-N-acetylmuramoyl-L-alanine--D-glutamate ligase [Myxococcales bacterium]